MIVRVGTVDLDVVLVTTGPWADDIKRLARSGQNAPPFGGKALDGGVTNAARRSGQDEGFLICHGDSLDGLAGGRKGRN